MSAPLSLRSPRARRSPRRSHLLSSRRRFTVAPAGELHPGIERHLDRVAAAKAHDPRLRKLVAGHRHVWQPQPRFPPSLQLACGPAPSAGELLGLRTLVTAPRHGPSAGGAAGELAEFRGGGRGTRGKRALEEQREGEG